MFVPCARYALDDVDDTGYPRYVPKEDGPYFALTDEILLLVPDL
jgi:hypothetical protein